MTPRLAVFAAFVAFGIGLGVWAGAVASVAARAGAAPGLLGLAVTGFIAASLAGMGLAGAASRGLALRTILLAAIAATAASLALLLQAASAPALVAGLLAYGLANGALDGAMNAEGTAVEADLKRPVLVAFHASSSFAVAVSALLGSWLTVRWGTQAAAGVALLTYGLGFLAVAAGAPVRSRPAEAEARSRLRAFSTPLVLLGLVVGVAIAGETAAIMFSGPALAEQAPALAAYAGFGATAFSLCQAMVRSVGDRLRRRVGDLRLIELSILGAAAGFAVLGSSASFAQSAIGFALVGIGTACLVPCGFSLAPRYAGVAAAPAIGALALVTALPRLPAPLLFGDLAARFSFAAAFAFNGVLFALALILVMRLRRRAGAAPALASAPG